jgi:hypothetical protein
VLEDDFYRFLWDGRMFAISGTPYGKAPADYFHEPGLGERFEWILNGINHPDLPTVYGPVCQLAFLAAYLIAPGRLWPLKLMLIAADLTAIALLRRAMRPAGMVLWLWCPLLIHEIAFSAHPDVLGIAALAGALVCTPFRSREGAATESTAGAGPRRAWAIGLWMAIATSARPFAVLLLPFVIGRNWQKTLAAFAGASLLLHIPLLVAPGGLAGLTAFAGQWEFNSSGFALLQAVFGTQAAKALGMLVFVGLYSLLMVRWRRGRTAPRAMVPPGDFIFGALLLVSPVVNPWYVLWLLPFVALRPAAWSVTLLGMVSLSYLTGGNLGSQVVHGFDHPPWVRPVEYGAVLVAAVVQWGRKRVKPRSESGVPEA